MIVQVVIECSLLANCGHSAFSGAVTVQTTTEFRGIENLDDNANGAIDEYFVELDSPDSGVLNIYGINVHSNCQYCCLQHGAYWYWWKCRWNRGSVKTPLVNRVSNHYCQLVGLIYFCD